MYDSKVGRVHVCYDTRELDKLVAEFTSDSTKLQDLLDDYISKDRRRRRVRRQKVGTPHFGLSRNTVLSPLWPLAVQAQEERRQQQWAEQLI